MAEIDRVYLSIDAFFTCWGDPFKHQKQYEDLSTCIYKCGVSAITKLASIKIEDRTEDQNSRAENVQYHIEVLDLAVKSSDPSKTVATLLAESNTGWDKTTAADPVKSPLATKTVKDCMTAAFFKDVASIAMAGRRFFYPLEGEHPWSPAPTAEEALRNDDDEYSFSIFDSIVDPIQESLPPLFQLGTEGWTPSDQEEKPAPFVYHKNEGPKQFVCPTCEAKTGEICKRSNGQKAKQSHKARRDLNAVEAAKYF